MEEIIWILNLKTFKISIMKIVIDVSVFKLLSSIPADILRKVVAFTVDCDLEDLTKEKEKLHKMGIDADTLSLDWKKSIALQSNEADIFVYRHCPLFDEAYAKALGVKSFVVRSSNVAHIWDFVRMEKGKR